MRRRPVPRRSPAAAAPVRSALSGAGRQQPPVCRRPPVVAAPVPSTDPRRGKAAIHDSTGIPKPKFIPGPLANFHLLRTLFLRILKNCRLLIIVAS